MSCLISYTDSETTKLNSKLNIGYNKNKSLNLCIFYAFALSTHQVKIWITTCVEQRWFIYLFIGAMARKIASTHFHFVNTFHLLVNKNPYAEKAITLSEIIIMIQLKISPSCQNKLMNLELTNLVIFLYQLREEHDG